MEIPRSPPAVARCLASFSSKPTCRTANRSSVLMHNECFFFHAPPPCSGAGHGAQRPLLLPAHQAGRPQRGLALPPQGGLAPDALPGPVPQLAGILQRGHSGAPALHEDVHERTLRLATAGLMRSLAAHRWPILISGTSSLTTSITASSCPCWHQLSTRFVLLLFNAHYVGVDLLG